ncbi:fibronectin/fibrinogen-binding protein [Anaerotruncus sp. AF02-27]|jgi:predicted ribosome quality control (RQC) complex YloA/Tae2 family protein|uniref:Rqc2 family fibronectin-binding protein n=1 Tax=Anaerotruncus TaxID=244127 RepID=UPI000E4E2DB8|nr:MULTISPECIES: NFACT RNA binding domain-containing protein [Anaerotruncus]RGX54276.1 fibronectin/fibrinogen-binding protein [Anaerotruncus sp. AF02-27]
MPLDGIFLNQLKNEIADVIVGGRVDKVHQPAKETIVLAMRVQAGNHKLLISASASNPRLHFTSLPQDNPKSPPMFCMLMRKHLANAKLVEIRQIGLDRILHLRFETVNEFGDKVVMTLAVEIMGRHSNIILVGPDNKVVDSIKRISDEMSRVRPVLPGMSYTLVPAPDRLSIFTAAPTEIAERIKCAPGLPLSKALLGVLEGMSPLVCREVAHNVTRGGDTVVSELTGEQEMRLKFYLSQLSDTLREGKAHPVMLVDAAGKPKDFSYIDLNQYGHTLVCRAYDTYSGLLDSFYSERDRIDRMHQRGADLLKLLVNLSDRTARKLSTQREELKTSTEREKLKIYGDLINSNLYALEKGQNTARVQNYYEEGCPEIEIPLDVRLTPAQNAQRYYAQYRKADTAEKKLRALIAQGEAELAYFDTVFDELARASLESELSAIRSELAGEGYVRSTMRRGMKEERLPPLKFISDDGFTILCGRNNLQNDRLTLKDSRNGDIWFHTQKIPGSHVVIITEGREVPNRTLEQAAVIAAWHSKARESGKVPVDYTQIRNVRKHPANKPGLVLYEPYQTAIVEPDRALVERLAQNR